MLNRKAILSLKYAMARAGLTCTEAIKNDGKLHYFQPLNSEHKTGWYSRNEEKVGFVDEQNIVGKAIEILLNYRTHKYDPRPVE